MRSGDFTDRLQRLLTAYRGAGCPIAVRYQRPDAEAQVRLGDEWRVEPSDDLLQRLRDDLGVSDVRMRYQDRVAG